VDDYNRGRLEAVEQPAPGEVSPVEQATVRGIVMLLRGVLFPEGKRRQFIATYAAWLRPHKAHVVLVFTLALVTAGLQMVEPLFMRFIVDNVLLTSLSLEERLTRLHVAGALFVAVVVVSNLTSVWKD
jgi:ABC-type multidrug transport system fused ATPase/permease subunit